MVEYYNIKWFGIVNAEIFRNATFIYIHNIHGDNYLRGRDITQKMLFEIQAYKDLTDEEKKQALEDVYKLKLTKE